MNNSMEKTIKKLKSRSIVMPILSFFFSSLMSCIFVAILVLVLIGVIMDTRYDSASFYAKKYANQISVAIKNNDDPADVLKSIQTENKKPLAIEVSDGSENIIAGYGEARKSEETVFDLDNEFQIRFRIDSATILKKNGTESELLINIKDMIHKIDSYQLGGDYYSEDIPFEERELYRYNYWIKTPIEGTDSYAYMKYALIFSVQDFLSIFVPAIVITVIFLLSCIGKLISGINEIATQSYYRNLLLSDPVTEGKNEFAFNTYAYKYISSATTRKSGFAIVDLTLNKYNNYCTLYGVENGEKLLTAIERIIRKNIHSGEFVCRVTNGDFRILLKTNKSTPNEIAIAGRAHGFVDALPNLIARYSENSLPGINNLSFKAGLYYLPPAIDEDSRNRRRKDKLNIQSLCIKAEMAKKALPEDSGFMVYNHEMWEKETWERKVEDMMQAALDNQEFHVYIQPKYHPSTEELKGAEALVRWISPTEGFISPGQFIPIFERTGFVTKLDDYMISHTAKLQSEWLAAGKKIVPVSVNVSRAHFAQPDLAEHIRDLVDKYPLPHEYIEIELTESAFFDDKNALLNTVHKLQEYGFEVSMDDFGSGYSSLNSLKDLPLNVLKLDAEFFRGGDFDGRGEIVVSEAISLAKQLNMKIVAEGIEKKEHVDFLASQNCDMIQGYYFAKPMPADEYESRMKEA